MSMLITITALAMIATGLYFIVVRAPLAHRKAVRVDARRQQVQDQFGPVVLWRNGVPSA